MSADLEEQIAQLENSLSLEQQRLEPDVDHLGVAAQLGREMISN